MLMIGSCILCIVLDVTDICGLEYCITLLKVTEPLEDRMEQALFSPPLSKQRVDYAVEHIKRSGATTLVPVQFTLSQLKTV